MATTTHGSTPIANTCVAAIKITPWLRCYLADTDPHQARVCSDLDPLSDELARLAMHAAARVSDADAIRQRMEILRREYDDTGVDLDLDPDTDSMKTSHALNLSSGGLLIGDGRARECLVFVVGLPGL